jgi:TolB-like protein
VVKTTGDGILAEFGSVVDAVRCAAAIQDGMRSRTMDDPRDSRITFRIGVNLGDVIVRDGDVFGDGVNVAARLEGLCEPGDVFVSASVREQALGKIEAEFEDLGEHTVKNISRPVRVYRLVTEGETDAAGSDAPPLPDKPSIAVLPFESMTADDEQDYFADGVTEDIITALSRYSQFFVIARNTTFTYKGQAVDVQAVAGALGVRYVLEGSVRRAGNRIRVTAQLIDGTDGNHLWAERYDRDLADIFELQDDITELVANSVETELGRAEQVRARGKTPGSFDAWAAYHQALAIYEQRSPEAMRETRRLFMRATELDPRFALAYAQYSMAGSRSAIYGYEPDPADDDLAAARRAIELDPDEPVAHVAMGYHHVVTNDFEAAIAEAATAARLNPNYVEAHHLLGIALVRAGRAREALPSLETAARLCPRGNYVGIIHGRFAQAYFALGDHENTVVWARKAIQYTQPRWAHAFLAAALAQLGRLDEARRVVDELRRVRPDLTLTMARGWTGFREAATREQFAEGLSLAGLDR